MMRRWLEGWDRYWFAPASAYPTAAFRALLGGYLALYFLTLAPDVTLLFSDQGVQLPWLLPDYAPSPLVAWLVYAATVISMLSLCLGWQTRLATVLSLVGFLYHYYLALAVKHSTFERLIIEWLLLLCFTDSGRVWSIDARGQQEPAEPVVDAWLGRLLRFQVVMLYLGAGLWKAANPAWRSGELMYATLQGMWSTDLGFALVRAFPSQGAWIAISWFVIVGEVLLGVFFCVRRTYWLGMLAGAAFHIGNVIFLSIPEFLVCIVPYVMFVDGARLQRWVAQLCTRWPLTIGQSRA